MAGADGFVLPSALSAIAGAGQDKAFAIIEMILFLGIFGGPAGLIGYGVGVFIEERVRLRDEKKTRS